MDITFIFSKFGITTILLGYLRHVDVIKEIYERFVALRTVILSRLFLQVFLYHPLSGLSGVVEVEGDVGGDVRLTETIQFLIHQ